MHLPTHASASTTDRQGGLGRHQFVLIAAVVLAAVAGVLHGEALGGGWRFDDGTHLLFAAKFAPWQYFFIPSITALQSAHVTPWNALFYDLAMMVSGLRPWAYYAEQLLVLWLTGLASVALLRCWVGRSVALFGAVVFLAGAPTLHIAHELMCGHYAAGLLFSVGSLLFYVHGVRRGGAWYSVGAAACYLMALSCKEVYAPLPGILLFLPTGTLRDRLRRLWPYVPVALFYVGWRRAVLGQFLGGYDSDASFHPLLAWELLQRLPALLLGHGVASMAALAAGTGLVLYALARRRLAVPLVLVALALLMLPLLPLVRNPGIGGSDRYLYAFWWAWSMGVAALLGLVDGRRSNLVRTVLGAVLLSAALHHAAGERATLRPLAARFEQTAAFALAEGADATLIPPDYDFRIIQVTRNILQASDRLYGVRPHPRILCDEEDLAGVDPAATRIYLYDESVRALREAGSDVPRLLAEFRAAETDRPLSYRIERRGRSFRWEFGPYTEGRYILELQGGGLLPLTRRGQRLFQRDHFRGRVRYISPEGWITRSPLLVVEPKKVDVLEWRRP